MFKSLISAMSPKGLTPCRLRHGFAYVTSTVTLISSCWFVQPARANLFLSPMYLKMESEQGQSKGVLQVGNTSSEPIRVRLSTTAFAYNSQGKFQRLQPDRDLKQDLTPYLRYSPTEMVIPANSSRRVRLISLLPPSLPEGEYRTAIFAEALQEKTNSQGYKVGFNISIGSALYVSKGETSADIEIIKANFDRSPEQLKILVANYGTATAKGKINWTLKQENKTIASGQSGGAFLPGTKTNLLLNRDREQIINFSPGTYQLRGEIVWENADDQKASNFNIDLEL